MREVKPVARCGNREKNNSFLFTESTDEGKQKKNFGNAQPSGRLDAATPSRGARGARYRRAPALVGSIPLPRKKNPGIFLQI